MDEPIGFATIEGAPKEIIGREPKCETCNSPIDSPTADCELCSRLAALPFRVLGNLHGMVQSIVREKFGEIANRLKRVRLMHPDLSEYDIVETYMIGRDGVGISLQAEDWHGEIVQRIEIPAAVIDDPEFREQWFAKEQERVAQENIDAAKREFERQQAEVQKAEQKEREEFERLRAKFDKTGRRNL